MNPKPHSVVNLMNASGDPIPNDQGATILNDAFSAAFSVPSILNVDASPCVDYFLMDPISIEFHGVVSLIDSLKVVIML